MIGSGYFGEVYSSQLRSTGNKVAVKTMKSSSKDQFVNELAHHIPMSHPHIVKLEGWTVFRSSLALVLEHMEGGTLLSSEL